MDDLSDRRGVSRTRRRSRGEESITGSCEGELSLEAALSTTHPRRAREETERGKGCAR